MRRQFGTTVGTAVPNSSSKMADVAGDLAELSIWNLLNNNRSVGEFWDEWLNTSNPCVFYYFIFSCSRFYSSIIGN
jgi:hypothetical protein